jgi:HTH-type transcriptional regulator/antitoxin HigA
MIVNERHYRATKAAVCFFEEALEHADQPYPHHSARLHEAVQRAMIGDLAHLRAELQEYEDFRAGKIRQLVMEKLSDLPDILIRARIASGLTQRELAEDLGLKEQQIQRYEASRYKSASLTRLINVALALDIQFHIEATLPNGAEFRAQRAQENAEFEALLQRAKSAPTEPENAEHPAQMGEVA